MTFDLKAAAEAAQSEADRAPFEVVWGPERFAIPNINTWPLAVQAGFVELSGQDTEQIDPLKVLHLLEQVIGPSYERFAATVPMSAVPTLVEAMAKAQAGVAMPDFSPPPELASTQT